MFSDSFARWMIRPMSKANAKAFLKKLMESADLVERCRSVDDEERLKIAAALGFPHTARDMQAVIEEGVNRARVRFEEMSETDLDRVSAGYGAVEIIMVPITVLQVLPTHVITRGPLEIDLQ